MIWTKGLELFTQKIIKKECNTKTVFDSYFCSQYTELCTACPIFLAQLAAYINYWGNEYGSLINCEGKERMCCFHLTGFMVAWFSCKTLAVPGNLLILFKFGVDIFKHLIIISKYLMHYIFFRKVKVILWLTHSTQ